MIEDMRLCWVISFQLCRRCEMDFEELYLYTTENVVYEDGRRPNPLDIKRCLSYLTRKGLVKQEQIIDEKLKECMENITDKRVKNKVKYCLARGKGTIHNILSPDKKLCRYLYDILTTKPYVLTGQEKLLMCFK